jgi:hypothetical protein
MRVLASADAARLAEATGGESAPALWGPRPAGPYSLRDGQAALSAWDRAAGGQFSLGVLRSAQLLGAVGLMPDHPGSAELATGYDPSSEAEASPRWPSVPRRPGPTVASPSPGSGWRSSPATSRRCVSPGALATASSGVFPGTAATGQPRMPSTTPGTTASSGPTRAISHPARNRIDVPPMLLQPHQCSIDAVRRRARAARRAAAGGWRAGRGRHRGRDCGRWAIDHMGRPRGKG